MCQGAFALPCGAAHPGRHCAGQAAYPGEAGPHGTQRNGEAQTGAGGGRGGIPGGGGRGGGRVSGGQHAEWCLPCATCVDVSSPAVRTPPPPPPPSNQSFAAILGNLMLLSASLLLFRSPKLVTPCWDVHTRQPTPLPPHFRPWRVSHDTHTHYILCFAITG